LIGIGHNSVIERTIVDKNARIGDGVRITPDGSRQLPRAQFLRSHRSSLFQECNCAGWHHHLTAQLDDGGARSVAAAIQSR
jgi:hypothetical protein